MKKILIIMAAATGVAAFSSSAEAKPAKCEIANGDNQYIGPCDFIGYKGGSFDLHLPDKGLEALGSGTFEVEIKAANRAIVYAYFPGRQPIANVIRDPKKPACWSGEGVRICAY